jgi:hypothetical protein
MGPSIFGRKRTEGTLTRKRYLQYRQYARTTEATGHQSSRVSNIQLLIPLLAVFVILLGLGILAGKR